MLSARIGITPEEFYNMTPFELSCYTEVYNDKQDELRQQVIVQSYLTAALARADKMPSLQSLLDTKAADNDTNVVDENVLLEELRRMNAAAGGVEIVPD
jgi:hypothetical protein